MKRIGIVVVLGLFLGFAPVLHAASICSANIPASTPAFTDNGDGTVTDPRTGLMWKRCSEGLSGTACTTGTAATYTWQGALQRAVLATDAGHADWRLPNIKELRSLVEEKCTGPSINEAYFPSTPASFFWSGSPDAYFSVNAWYVNFSYGGASYYLKDGSFSVRLVRGGQSFGSFDSSHSVALSATTLSFAAQNLGTTSAAQTVTLTNNGNTPLNIASIVASGNYAVTHNCGTGLGAGGFCTLNITFTPTATGTRIGSVTLTDDSIFSTKTISLTGTGQGAVASLSATAKTFASQNVGSTSAAQTITLTNTGVAVLNISSIVASGDFARTTTCGATLAMGANCTIDVTFTPTAAGARSGSIVISSDAASSPNTISLSGTGLAVPVVSLNPTSLTFAAQNVGSSSTAQSITLTNSGGAALNLTSISWSGDFAVTTNCGGGLGAGGFCSLSVTFTPTVAGTRTGAITITSNAAGSPHSVSLSGSDGSPTCTLTASPATITTGATSTLTATCTPLTGITYAWTGLGCAANTTNTCTVTGGNSAGSTTYTVTGTNAAGSGAAATATVTVAPPTPPVCTLTVTPAYISAGGSSTLTAGCTPAATSYAWTNSGFASTVSSGTVAPSTTTIYSVIGSNISGSGNKANAAVIVGTAVASQTDVRTYVPAASFPSGYVSYLRVINTGSAATPVSVARIDGATGAVGASGILTPSLAVRGAHTFSAQEVEAALGTTLAAGDRPRIRVTGAVSAVEVQSFLLQPGGLFDEISGAQSGSAILVRVYIPAADAGSGYTSYLRVINPGTVATPVTIALVDGETGAIGNTSTLIASLPGGAAQTLSSAEIEAAMGTAIAAGNRSRMQISGNAVLEVQSFITQPGGAFTNVSGGQ